MNTYYVYYTRTNMYGDPPTYTSTKEVRAANLDGLRKRLAREVLKRSNSRYTYEAAVMRGSNGGHIGWVSPYTDDLAVWEPADEKSQEEGAHYLISNATGKIGKKERWYRWGRSSHGSPSAVPVRPSTNRL